VVGVSLRIPCGEEAQSEASGRILLRSVLMQVMWNDVEWKAGYIFEGGDA
jgi:hypothetical protein